MTVHSFSSAAGAAAPLTRARASGSLPVWSLSLGCPKNRVDTEHLLGSLGMPVRSVEHMGRARLVFINTCGFIEPAVRESIRSVLDAVERLGRCKRRPLLAVAGCMVGALRRQGSGRRPARGGPVAAHQRAGALARHGARGPGPARRARGAGPPALHGPVLCLAQGGRGLPPQVRLLHHPFHQGPAALGARRRPARGGPRPAGRRGARTGPGGPGPDLVGQRLRHAPEPAPTAGRAAAPGPPDLAAPALPLPQRRHARTAALHARGRAAAAALLRHPPAARPSRGADPHGPPLRP